MPCASHFAASPRSASRADSRWKTSTNSRPMIRRFCSGIGRRRRAPRYISSAAFACTTRTPRLRENVSRTCVGLVLAQEAVVDEHAGELVADRLVDERGGDRRIDAARQPEDDVLASHLRADGRHGLVHVVRHVPVLRAAADVVREAREDRRALLRVRDLGMELHRVEAARRIGHRRDRACVAAADRRESRRQRGHLVAVAHPDVEEAVPFGVAAVLDAGEELRMSARADLGIAELAHAPGLDRAAQLRRHRLHAVADAEHRHALRPHGVGRARRVALGHAVRPAREHDALRREAPHEVVADVVRMDLAVDVRLAQAARDELRVLRAEIEDQDPGMGRGGHRITRRRTSPRRSAAAGEVIRRGNWELP